MTISGRTSGPCSPPLLPATISLITYSASISTGAGGAARYRCWVGKRRRDGVFLDLCAGTLDLAAELANQPQFGGKVIGADFVVPMLQRGVHKAERVQPVGADALDLPFGPNEFDGCTVGFGVRNLADIETGLAEMARVLKPGAKLVVLEFADHPRWPLRPMFRFYFHHILPRIGRLVSKHDSAYRYLPASVEGFPEPERFADLMRNGRLRECAIRIADAWHCHLVLG